MTPFDLLRDSLPPGVRVIEASAGTGKTFTLAGLVLRLVAEEGLSIDQILVVTYTNAATEELRDRVWKRLRSALDALERGASGDPLEQRLLVRAGIDVPRPEPVPAPTPARVEPSGAVSTEPNVTVEATDAVAEETPSFETADEGAPAPSPDQSTEPEPAPVPAEVAEPVVDPWAGIVADPAFRALAIQRLLDALTLFDEAAIFTIHGFCQRVLSDRAFEADRFFDTELSTDQPAMVAAVATDFWREETARFDAKLIASGLPETISPQTLAELARGFLPHSHCEVVPSADTGRQEEMPALLATAFDAVAACWATDRAAVLGLFGGGKDNPWFKQDLSADSAREEIANAFDLIFREQAWSADAFAWLDRLHTERIRGEMNQRKKATLPETPLLALLSTWLDLREEFALLLQAHFLTGLRAALEKHNRRSKSQTFDDLLRQVANALLRPGGVALAEGLRARHQTALIDEFQDTDPLQWAIFHSVFGRSDRHRLYLIGDPKQAIYGFRGADVATYLEARGVAGHESHTLATNWRSETSLVDAVNRLYQDHANPFGVAGIEYERVQSGGHADRTPLSDAQPGHAALELCTLSSDDDRPIGVAVARDLAAKAVVAEILRLLRTKDVRLGAEPVRPRDIAVLVRTNREAIDLQERLRAESIPSVLQAARSVYESDETTTLLRLLSALEAPQDLRRLRALLVRTEQGFFVADLLRLETDEAFAASTLDRFAALARLWAERGFAVMFRQWLQQERVRERLMKLPDGERRLTNLLHLGELLQTAELEGRRGSGLVQWLAEQSSANRAPSEAEEMRLESDESAVRLVTIHKSKGLEYPVVLCPFLWHSVEKRGQRAASPEAVPQAGEPPVFSLRGVESPEHKAALEQATLAEQLRLLYVALTRAKHRCVVFWGDVRGAETSALAWLLFGGRLSAERPPMDSLRTEMQRVDFRQRARLLRQLAERSSGHIAVRDGWADPAEIQARIRDEKAAEEAPPVQPERGRGRRQRGRGQRRRDEAPEAAPEAIAVVAEPELVRPSLPDLRNLRPWRIYSYSRLTLGAAEELPDHDAALLPPPPAESISLETIAPPADPFLEFPKGTAAGTCLHELIESIDFSAKPAAWKETIEKVLQRHLSDAARWQASVTAMLQRLAKVPLRHAHGSFTLSQVKPAARKNELEFFLPGGAIERGALASVFARHAATAPFAAWPRRVQDLAFEPGGGFLQGFIDAVVEHEGRWFILDWKSNWLGATAADYGPDALADAMNAHFYVLQYHLYAAALFRHLKVRLPGFDPAKHWGGVHYVFLRGLDEATPGRGVFHDRPSPALIADLESALLK